MNKLINGRALSKSPHHLLKRAAQHASNIYMQTVGHGGLTQRQYTLLQAVDLYEGASQSDLVRMTGIDRSTLADLAARLIDQGLLQRRRTREDARTNSVRLTAAGRRVLKAAEPGAGDVDKQIIASVPAKYRKGFLAGLEILASNVEENGAASAPRGRQAKAR